MLPPLQSVLELTSAAVPPSRSGADAATVAAPVMNPALLAAGVAEGKGKLKDGTRCVAGSVLLVLHMEKGWTGQGDTPTHVR